MTADSTYFFLHLRKFLSLAALLLIELLHFQLKTTPLFSDALILHFLLLNLLDTISYPS
jgi:hypothetical protein